MFMNAARLSQFREIARDRADEFFYRGYKRRLFFPHRIYYLPKCGPDGFKLANSMCGDCELDQLWETVIYATPPLIHGFPEEFFFDDDLIWHQQQFGKIGQIATANLVVDGDRCYSMVHISDLVQRISRRREYKTRIENRFKGWNHMLLANNGIFLCFLRPHQSFGVSERVLALPRIVRGSADGMDSSCLDGRLAVSRALRAGSSTIQLVA